MNNRSTSMIGIIPADESALITNAKQLFQEYAFSLGFDLCFQDFDREMATFPAQYSPPNGRLLLAQHDKKIVGCVGLRDSGNGSCEMKRLYVQPDFRGQSMGRALAEAIIKEARDIGYMRMRLDTLPSMKAAIGLYKALGFKKTEPYRFNPVQGAICMELSLR
jgi:ribosomal protein S18 acetylase RimI-like enzyme